VGVPQHVTLPMLREPPPAPRDARVDLPRKRER
jgi:hypothetical protein